MIGKSKVVLGKGLEALIPSFSHDVRPPDTETTTGEHAEGVGELPIDRIRPNPFQPREEFEPQAMEELKQSIIEHGVLQPVTVRRTPDGFELVAGERRWRAARAAGLASIPAFIKDVVSDEELLELALIENVQREHLNPIEVATGYQRLIDECRLTQEEVAVKVSKDRATVANMLRLLKLPSEIQDSLRRSELSMGHARALLAIPNHEAQVVAWRRIITEGLSVRRAESLARSLSGDGATQRKRAAHAPAPPVIDAPSPYRTVESRLRHALATQVRIRGARNGTGEIVIEFYSDEELERLLELMESTAK